MITKLKIPALALLLLLCSTAALLAQEKYEYANISWASWNSGKLIVSANGTQYSEEKIELPKAENSVFNANPLFQKLNEYQNQGWELVSINSYPVGTSMCHVAFLRKKK